MNEGIRLDRLAQSELDDFEEFRKQTFNYTYYCPKCIRSFDSEEEQKSCKFCNGPIMETWSKPDHKTVQKNYRYFCTKCEKNYMSKTIQEVCEICGSKFIHVYEWHRVKRDIFRTRIKKFSRRLKDLEIPRPITSDDATSAKSKFSLKDKLNYPFPKITFRRNQEELPTK